MLCGLDYTIQRATCGPQSFICTTSVPNLQIASFVSQMNVVYARCQHDLRYKAYGNEFPMFAINKVLTVASLVVKVKQRHCLSRVDVLLHLNAGLNKAPSPGHANILIAII